MRERSESRAILSFQSTFDIRHAFRGIAQEGRNHFARQLFVLTHAVKENRKGRFYGRGNGFLVSSLRPFSSGFFEQSIQVLQTKWLAYNGIEPCAHQAFPVGVTVVTGQSNENHRAIIIPTLEN